MTTFTTKILDVGVPTEAGLIYPAEEIVKATNEIASPILGQIGAPTTRQIDLCNVSHKATNLRIDNNALFADITVLETEKGKVLMDILPTVSFKLAGVGFVNPRTNTVWGLKISSINAEVQ